MQGFIESQGGLLATILLTAMCLNILLTALKTIVEKISGAIPSETESKILSALQKTCDILATIIDWTSANRAHNDNPPANKPSP